MANIFGIATTSLLAYQKALETAGNNIANVNTEGYSRQVVDLKSQPSQLFGQVYVGSGVQLVDIKRNTDEFASEQLRRANSSSEYNDTLHEQALSVDILMSQEGTSVSKSLQDFYAALDQMNQTPDDLASRTMFIEQTESTVDQFAAMYNQLDDLQTNSTLQVKNVVADINSLATNIAELNNSIVAGIGKGAPEFLDQRDQLILELSAYVDVRVLENTDGSVNVSVGAGEPLVIGGRASTLSAQASTTGFGTEISITISGAGSTEITDNITGGQLQGYLDFEQGILSQTKQTLGQMAIGFAQDFNAQHTQGYDLNNQFGADMFTDYNDASTGQSPASTRVLGFSTNVGTGTFTMTVDDIGQTIPTSYTMSVTAIPGSGGAGTVDVQIQRNSDGSFVSPAPAAAWTFPAGASSSISFEGYTVTIDNAANFDANDIFAVRPLDSAASQLQSAITDPKQLALAAPVRAEYSLNNTGDANIAITQILNTTNPVVNPSINDTFTFTFTEAPLGSGNFTYDIQQTGNYAGLLVAGAAYVAGSTITVTANDGAGGTAVFDVVIDGVPDNGDVFTVSENTGAAGDNRNGLLLAAFQQEKVFSDDISGNGTESVYDRYSNIIATVGSTTFQAKQKSEAATIIYNQSLDFRDGISGVNLDEEASNLLQLQQSYRASGQLIAVASRISDILFDSISR